MGGRGRQLLKKMRILRMRKKMIPTMILRTGERRRRRKKSLRRKLSKNKRLPRRPRKKGGRERQHK